MVSNKQVVELLFSSAEYKTFKCYLCGSRYKFDVKKGFQNLITHVQLSHSDWKTKIPPGSGSGSLNFSTFSSCSKQANNLFGWMHWVINKGLPFSMVEKERTSKYSRYWKNFSELLYYLGRGLSLSTDLSTIAKTVSKSNLEWVPCTSNIVERLFSIVRYIFN